MGNEVFTNGVGVEIESIEGQREKEAPEKSGTARIRKG